MELFLAENHSFPQKFLRIGIQSDPKNASWSGWWWFELVPFTLHRGAVCVWSGVFQWALDRHHCNFSIPRLCPIDPCSVQSMSTGYQLGSPQYSIHKGLKEKNMWIISGWWFQNMVYFHPKNWGSFPFWLIFFKGVETTKDRNKLPPPLATLIVYSFNIRNSLRLCERFFKSARTANCSVGLKILKSPKKSSALCVNSGDRCGPQKKVVLYRGYLPKTHGPHFNHWKTGEIWAKSPTMFVFIHSLTFLSTSPWMDCMARWGFCNFPGFRVHYPYLGLWMLWAFLWPRKVWLAGRGGGDWEIRACFFLNWSRKNMLAAWSNFWISTKKIKMILLMAEILHQLIWSISHIYMVLYHPQVVSRMSSINSMTLFSQFQLRQAFKGILAGNHVDWICLLLLTWNFSRANQNKEDPPIKTLVLEIPGVSQIS